MKKYLWFLPVTAIAFTVLVVSALAAQSTTVELARATVIIEVNSTDGDAGLQVSWDGEGWKSMAVFAPDGEKILDVENTGVLEGWGLTEGFFESREPPFDEVPLEDFLALFPEGDYAFRGTTIGGDELIGTATLSHVIPAGLKILSPQEEAVPGITEVVISWDPGPQPSGVEIIGYEVVVETEQDPLRVFSVRNLPAATTSVSVPAEFLAGATAFKFEVLAIDAGGNQTITEGAFETV